MNVESYIRKTFHLAIYFFASVFWGFFQQFAEGSKTHVNKSATILAATTKPVNNTTKAVEKNMPMHINVRGVTFRAIYVIAAVSGVIIVYFIAKAICNRRRNNRTRRYGILNDESRDHMEMRPLSEQDDDEDDDLTLFDMSKRKGKR